MKKLLFALVLLAPATLFAQSAFSGTWRFSTQSAQFSGKPLTFSLQNGVYRCDSCVPKIEVKADGKDHDRSGSPYSDAVSVRALDDHAIEVITKKGGKVVGTTKDTASPDGKTLTSDWSFVAENGQEGHGKTTSTRVAAAPEGAHQASGSWQPQKMDNASESILTVTFKATDDGLSMSDLTGDSYTAKFDGQDYPYKGDPGTTSVSLKKIDANTIEETDKRDGKAIVIARMTVSPDGRTMTVENTDVLRGTASKFEAKKQ
ncbi:MAG: hypothetical protein WAQ52_02435 [Terriglobales bacterium]